MGFLNEIHENRKKSKLGITQGIMNVIAELSIETPSKIIVDEIMRSTEINDYQKSLLTKFIQEYEMRK